MARQATTYDIALSFAGEDRPYVDQVAAELRDCGIRVFYDDYERVALWGKDLYSHLSYVYSRAARYCVVFISEHYARKVWTNHERRSAQARALEENREYVLPARFDDTEIEGLLPTIGYMPLSDLLPTELVALIVEKLGPRKIKAQFPREPDRLWEALGLTEDDDEHKDEARFVGYDFFDALRRMTPDERRAVAGIFAFGCMAELPELVHVSLDMLHRMVSIPKAELLELLAGVRSLGFTVRTREPLHDLEDGELAAEDIDLTINFFSNADLDDHATEIAYYATHSAADHFCKDHGLDMLVNLDFGHLSSAAVGPVMSGYDEDE